MCKLNALHVKPLPGAAVGVVTAPMGAARFVISGAPFTEGVPLALGRCDEHRARRVCSELVRLRGSRVREGTDTGNLRTCCKAQYLKITAWPSFGRQTLQTGVRRCKVLRGAFA